MERVELMHQAKNQQTVKSEPHSCMIISQLISYVKSHRLRNHIPKIIKLLDMRYVACKKYFENDTREYKLFFSTK